MQLIQTSSLISLTNQHTVLLSWLQQLSNNLANYHLSCKLTFEWHGEESVAWHTYELQAKRATCSVGQLSQSGISLSKFIASG